MLSRFNCVVAVVMSVSGAVAAEVNPASTRKAADYVPDVAALARPVSSELRELVERFEADQKELERFASVKSSAAHRARMREFYTTWQAKLAAMDFERLGVEGRIDATLLRTRLTHEVRLLDRDVKRAEEVAPLLPFVEEIARLQETRRFLQPVDAKAAAKVLDEVKKAIEKTRAAVEAGLKVAKKEDKAADGAKAVVAEGAKEKESNR
jgi:hypothetical protein